MKRFLLTSFVLWMLGAVAVFAYMEFVLPGVLKKKIEFQGELLLGTPVTVKSARARLSPFFSVQVLGLQARTAGWAAEFPKIQIQVSPMTLLTTQSLLANIRLEQPQITVFEKQKKPDAAAVPPQPWLPPVPGLQVQMSQRAGFQFSVVGGRVRWMPEFLPKGEEAPLVGLEDVQLELGCEDFREPMHLLFQARALHPQIPGNVPLTLKADADLQYALLESELAVSKVSVTVAGLQVQGQGTMKLAEMKHNFSFSTDVADLKTLPLPPEIKSVRPLGGQLKIQGALSQTGVTPFSGHAHIETKNMDLALDMQDTDGVLGGTVRVNSAMDLILLEEARASGTVNLDMSRVQARWRDLFLKADGSALSSEMEFTATPRQVSLTHGRFQMAHLKTDVAGTVEVGGAQAVNLNFQIPPTDLAGFEIFFPPLKENPLGGRIHVDGHVEGPFAEMEKLHVRLKPLLLENVTAHVHLKREDLFIDGTARVDTQMELLTAGETLQSAKARVLIDLGALTVEKKNTIQKPAGYPMKLTAVLNQSGDELEFQNSSVKARFGEILLKGRIKRPQAPLLNVKMDAASLDVADMLKLFPQFKDLSVAGTLKLNTDVSGTFDFKKGVAGSPLVVRGTAELKMPSYVMPVSLRAPPVKSDTKDAKSAKPPPPEPPLPAWPVFTNSDIGLKATIQRFEKEGMEAHNLSFDGRLFKGTLSGRGSVASVFGGRVDVTSLSIPVTQPLPATDVSVQTQNVDVAAAIAWALPEWKGVVRGLATGQMKGQFPFPSREDFSTAVTCEGSVKLAQASLISMKFDRLAGEKLAVIPGVGTRAAIPVVLGSSAIDSAFRVAKGIVEFSKLTVVTPDHNQMSAVGKMGLDKTLDMSAELALANAPVQGPVRDANSDAQKRFLLPVKIQGSVFKPQINILDATVKTLLERTAKHQATAIANPATQKLKQQATKAIKGVLGH